MKDFISNISKKVEVVPYNPEWGVMFDSEADRLRTTLQYACENLHHIGSTSIPGLSAKPILDIVVELSEDADTIEEKLEAVGYQYKGEFNIPLRRFFNKKSPFKVNLHVYTRGNPEIRLNLEFRDFLRKSEVHRLRYEALKMRLALDPSSHEKVGDFTKYTLGKNEFITDIISQTGFDSVCPRFCIHYAEWEAYHRIRQQQASSMGSEYNIKSLIYSSKTDYHIVIYKGISIIGAVHIDNAIDELSYLRFFHIEDQSSGNGVVQNLSKFLESWATLHKRRIVWE